MKMKITKAGLAVPADAPEKRGYPKLQTQEGLMQDQLPGFLSRLIHDGASIQSVYRVTATFSNRFCVAYIHHEQLCCEVCT